MIKNGLKGFKNGFRWVEKGGVGLVVEKLKKKN